MGAASLVGSLLPLVPFVVLPVLPAIAVSVAVAGFSLFAMGALKARATVGSPGREGLKLTTIGLVAAAFGWGVGMLFRTG